MMSKKIAPTLFCILSDTGNVNPMKQFAPPTIMPDVLLFCGGLTKLHDQSLKAYEDALAFIHAIPADFKLVIAGDQDIALDPKAWALLEQNSYTALERNVSIEQCGNLAYHQKVLDLMTSEKTKKKHIEYLTEGMHTFRLVNGGTLRIHATPYTPTGPCFKYEVHEDRFNIKTAYNFGGRTAADFGITDWGENHFPECPNVDVVMTHGAMCGFLDTNKDEKHVGDPRLYRAMSRARPKLHAFGQVSEAYGTGLVGWSLDKEDRVHGRDITKKEFIKPKHGINIYPDVMKLPQVKFGIETLVVNGALVEGNKITRNPVLVEILLDAFGPPLDLDNYLDRIEEVQRT